MGGVLFSRTVVIKVCGARVVGGGLRCLISVVGRRSISKLSAMYFEKTLGSSFIDFLIVYNQFRPLGCCQFRLLIGVIGINCNRLVVVFDAIASQVYRDY